STWPMMAKLKFEPLNAAAEKLGAPTAVKHTVIVPFWESWCKPCRREMKVLERDMKAGRISGVDVVAISLDEKKGVAKKLTKKLGVSFPVFLAPRGMKEKLNLPKFPFTMIFDGDHNFVGANSGLSNERFDLIRRRANASVRK